MKITKTITFEIPYKEASVPERLLFLVTANCRSTAEAARRLGFSQQALGHWLSAKRKPNIEVIVRFAKEFDVSTDWILGLAGDQE